MKIPLYQVDAFTDTVFGGNPAAVCPLETWIDDAVMQGIAQENNLSETAFFVRKGDAFEIRWFTPKIEIDLAGHPTLATAFVILEHLGYQGKRIVFLSKSGELTVERRGGLICMNFPAREAVPAADNELINKGLGNGPLELYKSRDYLAIFRDEEDILAIRPDFEALSRLDCLGIIVSAPGKTSDFVSRFFAPSAGINEDPVTGSSHTTLIPYWARRLHKNDLHALQLSARRGELFCSYLNDRVEIAGKAVTYLTGWITI
jgi:PhzF family phenazine biosynthesis protein